MDSTGRIHELQAFANLDLAAREDAMRKELAELTARVGPIVPIPPAELARVKAMAMPERRAWYDEQRRARKAERKRQRAARKAQRRGR